MIERVLMIGIDGGSWNVFQKFKRFNILTLNYLKENTAYGPLNSTIPPWTIPSWTTMFTGVEPDKHGIYGFFKKVKEKLIFVSGELDDQAYLWDFVSMNGRKVIAINVPTVRSAIPVRGYFIGGFLSHNENFAWPTWLKDKLKNWRYELDIPSGTMSDDEYVEKCVEITHKRTSLFMYLAERVKWDLGLLVYTCSDRIQHRFLKSRPSLVEYYFDVLDKNLSLIIDSFNDGRTLIIIVSDHGFKIPSEVFSVNAWLVYKGYLSLNSDIRSRVTRLIRHQISNNYILLSLGREFNKLFINMLKNNLSNKEGNILKSREIKGAYMASEDGSIFININPRIKDKFIQKIIKDLTIFNGGRITVYTAKQIYRRYIEEAPELILYSDRYAFSSDHLLPIKVKTIRATHAKDGIFIVLGPDHITRRGQITGVSVRDITPTILYSLGLPIPSYMDGKVVYDIFTDRFISYNKPKYIDISYNKARLKVKMHRLKIKRLYDGA